MGDQLLTQAESMVKFQGSKGSLDFLHLAVRVGQCLCNHFATFSSKIVPAQSAEHQAEEGRGVKGQYIDLSRVKGQGSRDSLDTGQGLGDQ